MTPHVSLLTPSGAKAHRRRGFVMLMTSLSMVALVPLVGLAVDVTLLYLVKTRLQAAVDAGAMAGGRALSRGLSLEVQREEATATAKAYFRANFPEGTLMVSSSPDPGVTIEEFTTPLRIRTVRLDANATSPLFFLRVLGSNAQSVAASGTALRRDVNMVLVIDRSGSMNSNGGCAAIVTAATGFVDKFANGRDNVGLVTFATSAAIDFAAQQNFKPAIEDMLEDLTCSNYTSSAHGISLGYNELLRLNEEGALNVILFFTDGKPNTLSFGGPDGATNLLPIKSSSGCSNQSPRAGTIIPGNDTKGIYLNTTPTQFTDGGLITPRSGCAFASDADNVYQDVWYLPEFDGFANDLDTGFKTPVRRYTSGSALGKIRVNDTETLENAAHNALVDAAQRIRTNATLKPVIYVIGLGDQDSYQHNMLGRIANDPNYPSSFDSTYAPGMYIAAPTAADLSAAFARVASEILKISQ